MQAIPLEGRGSTTASTRDGMDRTFEGDYHVESRSSFRLTDRPERQSYSPQDMLRPL
jgi:hypothetical protein